MFKRILVGIDRSAVNNKVFETAICLAAATKANLMLIHVLSELQEDYPQLPAHSYYPTWDEQTVKIYQEQWEEYKQESLKILQNLGEQAAQKGIPTEFTQVSGTPERSICDLAVNWQADLIVVGNRGLTGLKEALLGSVSNYITHHAPCSVFLVRDLNTVTVPFPSTPAET